MMHTFSIWLPAANEATFFLMGVVVTLIVIVFLVLCSGD